MIQSGKCFTYDLADDRIAQRPVYPYDAAKMLVADRSSAQISDSKFSDLPSFLTERDVLVLNNSQVIPARLFGALEQGSGVEIELLLLKPHSDGAWICTGKPLKKLKTGSKVFFDLGLIGDVIERPSATEVLVRFSSADAVSVPELLTKIGLMPIPPYIRGGRSDAKDVSDYQPLLAKVPGSVAASTASLHFTTALMEKVAKVGCRVVTVTLHLGPPSFQPIFRVGQGESITPPGIERCCFDGKTLRSLFDAREMGGRIFAVGTSAVRAIESMARLPQPLVDGGWFDCDLFIAPPFQFKVVDCMITNLHQPYSTHLLLVQAFLGRELLERSYQHALSADYRFLSYGDGMLIL